MSLALLNTAQLRILADPNFVTKLASLSWIEEDTNFKLICDAIRELANADIGGLDPFDPAVEYSNVAPDFVSYAGNIYKYISATPSTGIVPDSDPATWELSSAGAFSHKQNTDTKLAEGTPDEVSASDLRILVDGFRPYFILKSTGPNGHCWKFTANDNGAISQPGEDVGLMTDGFWNEIILKSTGPDAHFWKFTTNDNGEISDPGEDLGI